MHKRPDMQILLDKRIRLRYTPDNLNKGCDGDQYAQSTGAERRRMLRAFPESRGSHP